MRLQEIRKAFRYGQPVVLLLILLPAIALFFVVAYALNTVLALDELENSAGKANAEWTAVHLESIHLFTFNEHRATDHARWNEAVSSFDRTLHAMETMAKELHLSANIQTRLENTLAVWALTQGRLERGQSFHERLAETELGEMLSETPFTTIVDRAIGQEPVQEHPLNDVWLFYRMQDIVTDLEASGEVFQALLREVEVEVREVSGARIRVVIGIAMLSSLFIVLAGFLSLRFAKTARTHSQRKFEGLLESAPDAMIIVNEQGDIVLVNAVTEQVFGFPPNELIGHPIEILVPDRITNHVALRNEFMRNTRVRGMDSGLDLVGKRKDGSEFPAEVTLSPQRTNDGILVTAAVRDITQRRADEEARRSMERQMQQAQKLESLGVLAGGIAHDFNNLLFGIMGNVDLALTTLSESAEARRYLEEVAQATDRSSDLCRELLAYSGRGDFVVQTVDLNTILLGMEHLLRVSLSKKTLIRFDLEENLPPIDVDVTQLRQIVMNLMTNASESLRGGPGEVLITSGTMELQADSSVNQTTGASPPAGLYVYFKVADTGSGISEGDLERIFDPFYTSKETGHGLGLAAVQGIIRGHRGTINVQSAVGEGTTFQVAYPASEKSVDVMPVIEEAAESWRGSGKILVADDEESNRLLLRRMCESLGFEVELRIDGQDALDAFGDSGEGIDFVLLDITMPVMSGLEAFGRMRKMRPDIPLILASGYSEEDAAPDIVTDEHAYFLHKPFRKSELLDVLRAAWEIRFAQTES